MAHAVKAVIFMSSLGFLKDVRAKIFQSIEFLKIFTAGRQWVTCARDAKKIGGHRLCFRDKACGKLYWFRKIVPYN